MQAMQQCLLGAGHERLFCDFYCMDVSFDENCCIDLLITLIITSMVFYIVIYIDFLL